MRELSLHLLDLIENAIEAGARSVDVSIIEDPAQDRLTIAVADDGRGMAPELAARAADPFTTTRTTRRVGLGLALLAAACERCQGSLDIQSTPGRGTTVTASFRRSHIDLAPLGDIAGTLATVIGGNPGIELTYHHVFGERQFCLSTRELKERLGEVPLNVPAICEWLREYVADGLAQLRGEAQWRG